MHSIRWLAVTLVLSAASALSWARDASACGGCFTAPPPPAAPSQSVDSVITAERMIFSISKDATTLFDEITYSGSPASFAWVLPIKGSVDVGLSADVLFATIDQLTASKVVGPESRGCPPAPVCAQSYGYSPGCGCGSSASFEYPSGATGGTVTGVPSSCTTVNSYIVVAASDCAFAGCTGGMAYALCDGTSYAECSCANPGAGWFEATAAPPAVTVNAQAQVGPYEAVQLHSNDGSALTRWLDSHGYRVPPADAAVIDHYVAEGMDFLALKLVPGVGVHAMQPVRVTTRGAFPVLPLRMVGVGTGATTGVTLWIVADGRWEPQNFPWFTITDSELAWDWTTHASNFESLRLSKEAALKGAGWQVESSIDVSQYSIGNALENAIAGLSAGTGGYAALPGAGDAGILDGDGGLPSDGGEGGAGESAAAEADLAALFAGMALPNVRITRLRGDLAHSALSRDLVVQAAADTGEIARTYHTTLETGEPLCPIYDADCVQTGEAPRDVAQAEASGGCSTLARRSATSRSSLALLAAFAAAVALRSRRRRRRDRT